MVGRVRLRPSYEPSQTINHFKCAHKSAHYPCPNIAIRTIIGGLHLRHASKDRLERTISYLTSLDIERLVLMHCTGENAVEYLRTHLACEVAELPAGRGMNE